MASFDGNDLGGVIAPFGDGTLEGGVAVSYDGDELSGIINRYADGTLQGGAGASYDGDELGGIINRYADGTLGVAVHNSRNGDVLNLCSEGGSVVPTGNAVWTITKLSATPYRIVYRVQAVVAGGGADASTTIANATLIADSVYGPLRTDILAKVYATAAIATSRLTSGNGEANIYGSIGSGAMWALEIGIDGSNRPTISPKIYTLVDTTFVAIVETIFRHSIVV